MQQDKLQYETFISATFRLNSYFPTSLRGRDARNLVNAETTKRERQHLKGCCKHRAYFSCLSSVDNLFKFPDFALSSGHGELSVGGIPMGIRPYVSGAKERTEGGSCRISAASQEKHLNAKTRFKDWPQGRNSFNDFVNKMSWYSLTKSKYSKNHKSLGHQVQIEHVLLTQPTLVGNFTVTHFHVKCML